MKATSGYGRMKPVFALALMVCLLLVIPCVSAHAEGEFQPDENGVYHIKNIDDWNAFINESQQANTFVDNTIVLESDLNLTGVEHTTFQIFSGQFDGGGHEIVYSCSDLSTNSTIFPVYLRNGSIKNLNIKVDECSLDASKHDLSATNGSILFYAGGSRKKRGTLEKINIYGDINVVINVSQNNEITCNGLNASNTTLTDCTVNLKYNLDSSSMQEFLKNDKDYTLKLQLFQFGFKNNENVIYKNCYALGGCTESILNFSSSLEDYYAKDTDANDFTLITAFAGASSGITPSSQENCYYNSEIAPVCLFGCDAAKTYASDLFLDDDTMAKTTADLKKQETFVDYDFDNVWGISEYINDGYPYLRSLVNPELVALVEQIAALPEPDKLTKEDKEQVEQIKAALKGLSDKDKAQISFDALEDKVAKAEEAIKAMEDDQKPEGDTEKQDPAEKTTEKKAATTISVKKGTSFKIKGYKYKVTGVSKKNPTVTITGYKNKKLKKIVIPATVTYKKVKFKVTAVGNNAFKGQKKAAAVTIGANVKTIGKAAFSGDAKAKKFTIKTKVLKRVGAKAFKGVNKKAVIKVPAKKLKAYKKLLKDKSLAKTVKIK